MICQIPNELSTKGSYPKTVPRPHIKKKQVSRRKEDCDGAVISSGVLEISQAKRLNPVENRPADAREHTHGPYESIIFPTTTANGYWPMIPLPVGKQLVKQSMVNIVNVATHASTTVVSCVCVSFRCKARAGDSIGNVKMPPETKLVDETSASAKW